ncbi:hypothetical protein [Azospirillum canadense]|uniref:hypothetical protein n=1 Tax=Azospirillum canadense TaxID=403962 RepID=UPI0022263424|nr:hypothetical protein [Azospirillum canadense]MCW2241304.1 hypothetical protein [Azospirillum canadense]
MKHLQIAAGASLLALAAATFALPASAQSTGGTMPQNSGSQSSGSQGASPSTGALPDNSLAGQRQGTVGGAVTQGGGGQSGTSGSSGTTTYGSPGAGSTGNSSGAATSGSSGGATGGTGALPDNSLAGQRQGAIGGGSVSQGGNNSGPPKQGSGQ